MKIAYLNTDDLLGTSLELIQFNEAPEEFQYPQREEDLKFLREPYFFEVCIVVKDLERHLEQMRSLFDMTPYLVRPTKIRGFSLHDRKMPEAKFIYSYFHAGPMRLEMLQPVEGESIYMEFLNKKGVCIQHIGCRTSNLDSEVAQLEKRGIGVTQILDYPEAQIKIVNTDTQNIAGIEFELIQSEGIPGE